MSGRALLAVGVVLVGIGTAALPAAISNQAPAVPAWSPAIAPGAAAPGAPEGVPPLVRPRSGGQQGGAPRGPAGSVRREATPGRSRTGPPAAAVPAVSGSPADHAFPVWIDGEPVRWNPCTTIRWQLNPTGAPPEAHRDVTRALREVSDATGIRFSYGGGTSYVARRGEPVPPPEEAQLFFAWATVEQVPELAGKLGVGGFVYSDPEPGEAHITSGYVVLDRFAPVAPGWGRGVTRGALLLHETGHALNLGHVSAPSQVMYSRLQAGSQAAYQRGDLAGLRRLGLAAGCVDTG